MPGGLLTADEGGLVLRQYLGIHGVHPHLPGHGLGGLAVVAGHHHHLADAAGVKGGHGVPGLPAQGVVADEDLFPLHHAGDAVGHHILHLGVVLLVGQTSGPGLLHHSVGHGVGIVLLQAGGQP